MKEQLLTTLENSRNYTVQVAEAMPGNAFHYKPSGAGWNFGELLHHIAYGIHWWKDNYIRGAETPWNPPPAKSDKRGILEDLNQAYDTLKETIQRQPLTDAAVKGFHATIDHATHHRGQAVLYLRTNGITPPEYTY